MSAGSVVLPLVALLWLLAVPAGGAPAPPPGDAGTPRLDRLPPNVRVLHSRRGRVVLRSSDDGDPDTWEGLLEASHLSNGAAAAYSVRVRLGGAGAPRTLSVRLLEHQPPLAARCGRTTPATGDPGAAPPRRLRQLQAPMAFYRCAVDRCFATARRCRGSGAATGNCLANRCRRALLSCVERALGCR